MKIAILGATGFVGRNIYEYLAGKAEVAGFGRSVEASSDLQFLDLSDKSSWEVLVDYHPDVIINSAAYGVVKTQKDLDTMYNTNYFNTVALIRYLSEEGVQPFWFQIGTAFEYDLEVGEIDESSICQPFTHYGISKLMCSNYFLNYLKKGEFTILRPFGMFGKYEDTTKIFPALLNAQKMQETIDLSSGVQRRDYLYVLDLVRFVLHLINTHSLSELPSIINVGSGELSSLKTMAAEMANSLDKFDANLWNWGSLEFRSGESEYFRNSSKLAFKLGLEVTEHSLAFSEITDYYTK